MAEGALKKLEEQLNCSICLDTYTDPKELQCHHVFCQKCLVRMVIRDQQGQLTLTCPTCRQVTPIPPDGVRSLQSAFHINHLLEIRDSVKKIQDTSSSLLEGVAGGNADQSNVKKASYCTTHSKRELELYCDTCEELICMKCAIAGGKHHSHTYMELAEAFEKYKGEIKSSLEPMENQLVVIKTALEQLDSHCGEISDQRESVEADIHTTVEHLHQFLDARKTELIDKLHSITQAKLKDLGVQRDLLETVQAQLSSCLEYTRESFQTGNQGEVLKMKKTIATQVKDLSTTFQPKMLIPNTDANDMVFVVTNDFTAECKSYGAVFMAHATGKGLETAIVGETANIQLNASDTKNQSHDIPIQCELLSGITGDRIQGCVKRRGQNQYVISYQPSIKGRHQLHIKIFSKHIRGSPFSVAVTSSVKNFGIPIATIGGVVEPWGIALNHRGELVVAEKGAHRISVLSPKGEKLLTFGSYGDAQGYFDQPRGVAVDGDGNILVVDNSNHRIQKFTATGQFLAAAGSKGSCQFSYPQDIAFNTINNKLYVVDFNHTVHVLNSDLTCAHIFGCHGRGIAEFIFPWGIACDSAGKVYVADTANNRIQVFTAEGRFLTMIGGIDGAKGQLKEPYAIATGTSGMVYVLKGTNGISIFTADGKLVMEFRRKGNEYRALAVDSCEIMYACDTNGYIELY